MASGELEAALDQARHDLLDERNAQGYWEGELSASALSTATAISALSLTLRKSSTSAEVSLYRGLIQRGVEWIARRQNDDGGWGDTDRSHSNIATTMLVVAAFELADVAELHVRALAQARRYIQACGGTDGLRARYGRDKTFAVPILTNAALAGQTPWSDVSALPFELACFPQSWYRFLRMPVVSYAIPALVAIGQARFHHRPPWNPLTRIARSLGRHRSLDVLRTMQPESGGFLEAVPLTSFVVMSLVSIGQDEHPVAERGLEFLVRSAREDGSWPIDTNLATWNTSLAVNHLAAGDYDVAQLNCLDWLLACQHRQRHPYTGAEPGGWGWSDLSGAVPDADDTPAALLALRHWYQSPTCPDHDRQQIAEAARGGLAWLWDLQNADGGWPTFCRGWGKLPFDRSGCDLTAHALRAGWAWRDKLASWGMQPRWERARQRGLRFLARQQRSDGSWIPLWFGNQDHPEEENPIYGTSKVLAAYRDLQQIKAAEAVRARRWLFAQQNPDGGWGGGPATERFTSLAGLSTVEETALAIEVLVEALGDDSAAASRQKVADGVKWLVEAVKSGHHREASPIGFYFARLWYYERLYPLTFTVSALGRAVLTRKGSASVASPNPALDSV